MAQANEAKAAGLTHNGAFARYRRDRGFAVLGRNRAFVLVMGAGSIAGSFVGGRMLGAVPAFVLLPLLVAILLVSAGKMWRQPPTPPVGAAAAGGA